MENNMNPQEIRKLMESLDEPSKLNEQGGDKLLDLITNPKLQKEFKNKLESARIAAAAAMAEFEKIENLPIEVGYEDSVGFVSNLTSSISEARKKMKTFLRQSKDIDQKIAQKKEWYLSNPRRKKKYLNRTSQ